MLPCKCFSVALRLSCILPLFTFSSLQLLNPVQLFAIPWTAAHQASLSITNSWSLLKFTSIGSVMPCNHLIFCRPLLLLPSVFPSIRGFSNESALGIRWLKDWRFSISTSNDYSGLISFRIDLFDLLAFHGTHESSATVFSNPTVQRHQFFESKLFLWSNSHIYT